MDISLCCGEQDLQPSMNQEICPDSAHHDDSMNELGIFLSETLRIEDDDVKHASNVDGINKLVVERNESEELDIEWSICPLKCLSKCATFPFPYMALPDDASANGGDEELPQSACPPTVSLPVSVSLNPAGIMFVFIIKLLILFSV